METKKNTAFKLPFKARLVYFGAGIVETLLLIRFSLLLFGVGSSNWLVKVALGVSAPLVKPFEFITYQELSYGLARFEPESLVAMVVYAVLTYIVVGAMSLRKRRISDQELDTETRTRDTNEDTSRSER